MSDSTANNSVSDLSISGFRGSETQILLWPDDLGNHGHVRTVVGDLAEQLTAHLVCGRRHRTTGRADYCPDVSVDVEGETIYLESKAVGRSREAFVYKGRIEKDKLFSTNHHLFYILWHHVCKTNEYTTVAELQAALLASMRVLYLLPFAAIDSICEGLKVEPLNSQYGRNREEGQTHVYGSGYRIKRPLLEPFRIATFASGLGSITEVETFAFRVFQSHVFTKRIL